MILRKLFVCVITLLVSTSALADKNSLFVQNYLNSFASRDAESIFQLINWEGVDKESRNSLQKYIKSGFKGRQIRRIYIDPIAEGNTPSYVQNGKTYELNLVPTGQLNIIYISNKGKRTTTQLFVGDHNGQMKIGSAVVAAESLACNGQKDSKTSC
ncbi:MULTISPECIES: hypothetical protein [unclassified Neptuniibacter]|uniref:hypothetical protein n=1 Tax=unclassified Neptuniibacter TaxID=2630693 RepID=UPI000C42B4E0|nr:MULTISPECIES: hypothetical protein [unclassified Neptuniibacter]MAY41602.1 hypothetical protein [Oceanospirillaceae bacterium]|tara:strand:- start:7697 stop:8164 length:468 start_codon:yes stop_codon:yes gene_type:complete